MTKGLKVIAVGLGRTGTDSLMHAIELLGFGPCHHMSKLRADGSLVPAWLDVARGGTPDWDALFEGFNAAADWPSVHYWRETTAHYPDAKVILTTRSPESWYKSMRATILPFMEAKGQHLPEHRNDIAEFCQIVINDRCKDEATARATLLDHEAAVRKTIPEDRLLVYPVGSGWAPLCAHLGVEQPDAPFPSGNTTQAFQDRIAANLKPKS